MDTRIKNTMAAVFNIDAAQITESASSDTIEGWDSLGHMSLIVALEEEFEIVFDDSEMVDMVDYNTIYETIKNKLKSV